VIFRRRPLPAAIALDAPPVVVRLRVDARARRFTLRPTAGGGAVLTLPEGVPERDARDFLERHAGWLTGALSRIPALVTVSPGLCLPLDGVPAEIVVARVTAPRLEAGRLLVPEGRAAGPALQAFLKRRARDRLGAAARGHAETLGRRVAAVSIRDTRSRWGSCSSTGRLSFSWRIAMAPEEVQGYLAAHEAAHLVEMNHSARYWAVLAGLMPDYERPRAWLKREGRTLHRYRFDV